MIFRLTKGEKPVSNHTLEQRGRGHRASRFRYDRDTRKFITYTVEEAGQSEEDQLGPSSPGTIAVIVGQNEVCFEVHRDLAVANSGFFQAACSNTWKESAEATVRLPDQRPDNMRIFVEWLYLKPDFSIHFIDTDQHDPIDRQLWPLQKLFLKNVDVCIMADYFDAVELKRDIIDCLLNNRNRLSLLHTIADKVWDNTTPMSGLRLWLMDSLAATLTQEEALGKSGKLPKGLLHELLPRLGRDASGKQQVNRVPRIAERCNYHEHKEGEWCGAVTG